VTWDSTFFKVRNEATFGVYCAKEERP